MIKDSQETSKLIWIENRVTLYLKASRTELKNPEQKAQKAVLQALDFFANRNVSEVDILKQSLDFVQKYIVCPLAQSRPMSISHMLPEGFN